MTPALLIQTLTFALPIFSALVCFALVLPVRAEPGVRGDVRLRRLLAAYFLMAGFSWFVMLIYPWFKELMVWLQSVWYFAILGMQVVFYHFVFNMTRLDGRRFPWWHYAAPCTVFVALFVWSFFVPFSVQVGLLEGRGAQDGFRAYSMLFLSKPAVRLVFSTVYTVLSVVRIVGYRRVVADFSANDERSSLRWIDGVFVLAFGFLLMPIIGVARGRGAVYDPGPSVFTAVIVAVQHVLLTVNTLRGRYLIPEEEEEREAVPCAEAEALSAAARQVARLGTAEFEEYIRDSKPFLDPNLRITDLAAGLCSNRTYVSAFINETYGVSFSRLMNRLRMEELERLRAEPANARSSHSRLAEMAGFGSYRNYLRARSS
jgi:AraC-like DNA-binding protein